MSYTMETLEDQSVKLTVTIPAAEVEDTTQSIYESRKSNFEIPGFRKGKVPRGTLEKIYGSSLFYEDAVNRLVPGAYQDAVRESGLQVVSEPEIEYLTNEPGKDLVFAAVVAVKPKVTLGPYRGVEIPAVELRPLTEEEIDEAINRDLHQHTAPATVTGRSAQWGDIALIDYEGFHNGVPFEGGKGLGTRLELGSGAFIPGFEAQVVGHEIGETFDISVRFPDTYPVPDLRGEQVIFKIVLHGLESAALPELNDAYAQKYHHCDTVTAYRAQVARQLLEAHKAEEQEQKLDRIMTRIIQSSQLHITQPMISYEANLMIRDFTANMMRQQGLTLQRYLENTNQTEAGFRAAAETDALHRLELRWTMEAIVEAEQIVITDEELEAEYEKLAAPYHMSAREFRTYISEKAVIANLSRSRVLDIILSTAKEIPAGAE